MLSSKTYAALAVALTFAGAAPAQAGWDGWQWITIYEKAHQQHATVAPVPRYGPYGAYAKAEWSRYPALKRPGKRVRR